MQLRDGYFITALTCAILEVSFSYTVKDINDLKAKLMTGYNKHTSPFAGDNVNVSVDVIINSIGDLDEQAEKLSADLELLTMWEDPSLTWNVTEHDIYRLEMYPSEVWVPEIYVHNRHHDLSIGTLIRQSMPIEYYATGLAIFIQYITTETTCDLDTSSFPFDRHACTIEFHVNKWHMSVKPRFKDFILSDFQPDGSWDVTNATIEGKGRSIMVHIRFKRKPTFILLNLILPITLLAMLSPMVFLLPNKSGERVGFSVTILLALSVYMTIISDYVPQKSDPMPLISTVLFITYSLTSVVIIVVILNARVYRLPESILIPRCLCMLFTVSICLCRCVRRRHKTNEVFVNQENESLTGKDQESEQSEGKRPVCWKDVSWSIDMVFMILLYVVKIMLLVVFLAVVTFVRL